MCILRECIPVVWNEWKRLKHEERSLHNRKKPNFISLNNNASNMNETRVAPDQNIFRETKFILNYSLIPDWFYRARISICRENKLNMRTHLAQLHRQL